MRASSPPTKETPPAEDGPAEPRSTILGRLTDRHAELLPAIEWMRANGCAPGPVVDVALAKLVERRNFLPREQRIAYAKKVLLGEFFYRWAKKHHGKTTVRELRDDATTNESEIRPIRLALMAVGDKRTFMKTLPRLAKVRTVRGYGGDLGNAHDFSCFVVNHATLLAHRFLANYDPRVKNAAAKAVKYMELTAVSHYLRSGPHVERDDGGIANHLRTSRRLNDRTKLAAKLAYQPSTLSDHERQVLRERYGVRDSLAKRMKIKDVAALLGYPTAQDLYRKLHRLKQWVRSRQKRLATEVPL